MNRHANYSAPALFAYDSDSKRLATFYCHPPEVRTAEDPRTLLDSFTHLKLASRARKQAALDSFFTLSFLYNEYIHAKENGGKRRRVLLDGPRFVAQLRAYRKYSDYRHGPRFRAQRNGRDSTLCYQSIQQLWQRCCEMASVSCAVHRLRHTDAIELVNDGVSLAPIRGRLGRKNIQMTLRSAVESDETADPDLLAR